MTRTMSAVPRRVPAAVRADCVDAMMPTCLQAMFAGLTDDQRLQLAQTMHATIDRAQPPLATGTKRSTAQGTWRPPPPA